MDKKLQALLLQLKVLRPNAVQFILFAAIHPGSMIALRKEMHKAKTDNPDKNEVDVIIFSPGGTADDAYRMIRTLRKNFTKVNVIVPFWAKSAATLFSLGANTIIMDEFGEFGPLDAQIGKARDDSPGYDPESALNDEHSVSIIENRFKMMYEQMFIRLYEHRTINIPKLELSEQLIGNLSKFFKPLLSQIDPYKLGDKKRKLDIGEQYAKRILAQFGSGIDELLSRELVDYLIHGCPDHGYIIDKDIIEKFVSNVSGSEIFGVEYKNALQQLSLYLMEESPESEMIGILEEDNIDTAKTDSSNAETNGHNTNEAFVEDVLKKAEKNKKKVG